MHIGAGLVGDCQGLWAPPHLAHIIQYRSTMRSVLWSGLDLLCRTSQPRCLRPFRPLELTTLFDVAPSPPPSPPDPSKKSATLESYLDRWEPLSPTQ